MSFLYELSRLLGTDPVSLLVVALLSAVCASFMRRTSGKDWMSIVSFPILLAGALLADDAATAIGLYPALSSGDLSNVDLMANWRVVQNTLPNILTSAVVGISLSGALLLLAVRCFGK